MDVFEQEIGEVMSMKIYRGDSYMFDWQGSKYDPELPHRYDSGYALESKLSSHPTIKFDPAYGDDANDIFASFLFVSRRLRR